jgi:RimJ/RimL family protein N-acetyltransferase
MGELRTERLLLRRWRESDREPWAAMNADPEVREYLGRVLTRAESDASVASFQAEFDERGYGWWAVEVQATGEFVGFAGLDDVEPDVPVSGVEIGWRLGRSSWGHGYATEAARATLEFGFATLDLPEILAITTATNVRSQAVMRRLGMTHNPADDFEDSSVAEDSPLRHHVVYRVAR